MERRRDAVEQQQRHCANPLCDKPMPAGVRADATHCSKACRTAAWRLRTRAAAHASEDGRTASIPAYQLAEALSSSASRVGSALTRGEPVEAFDVDRLQVIASALIARAKAAHPDTDWADSAPQPTVAVLNLAAPTTPEASRDASAGPADGGSRTAAALPPERTASRPVAEPSRDASGSIGVRRRAAAAEPAFRPKTKDEIRAELLTRVRGGRKRLTQKDARALVDGAHVVKDPEHRDNHTWHLVGADGTEIAHARPSYGGVSSSGRNGWTGWPHGMSPTRDRRYATRDTALASAASDWIRLATQKPTR
jgi:hypothetical protein